MFENHVSIQERLFSFLRQHTIARLFGQLFTARLTLRRENARSDCPSHKLENRLGACVEE